MKMPDDRIPIGEQYLVEIFGFHYEHVVEYWFNKLWKYRGLEFKDRYWWESER